MINDERDTDLQRQRRASYRYRNVASRKRLDRLMPGNSGPADGKWNARHDERMMTCCGIDISRD
jgi:deoxyribodipyrimidine photolyase-like uncharacterized protein